MFKTKYFLILFFVLANSALAQTIDAPLSQKKMKKDLQIFKSIRIEANSGLYKYRTKQQIDSIYNWAENQIDKSFTYLDFYNIICKLTDFEGSLHNNTTLSNKILKALKAEKTGYFPYPLKWIDGKWVLNFENQEIPLGSEIIAVNDEEIQNVIEQLYKYYTTDGLNLTGKRVGINTHFSKYYRFNYGLKDYFTIKYKVPNTNIIQSKKIKSVAYSDYYKNFKNRFSKPFDQTYYADLKEHQKYNFKKIDSSIAILTINTFAIGNNESVSFPVLVQVKTKLFSFRQPKNFEGVSVAKA